MADNDAYVTNHVWVRTVGRPDALDEIADQFERPVATELPVAIDQGSVRWPQRSRGWRSIARLHPQPARVSV